MKKGLISHYYCTPLPLVPWTLCCYGFAAVRGKEDGKVNTSDWNSLQRSLGGHQRGLCSSWYGAVWCSQPDSGISCQRSSKSPLFPSPSMVASIASVNNSPAMMYRRLSRLLLFVVIVLGIIVELNAWLTEEAVCHKLWVCLVRDYTGLSRQSLLLSDMLPDKSVHYWIKVVSEWQEWLVFLNQLFLDVQDGFFFCTHNLECFKGLIMI